VTRYHLQEGAERDVEICEVRTGSGLRFGVCPSRGMDIVWAEHNGRPLCWNSATGVVHPAFYEQDNLGWLRGFGGGLLTTCGLSSFGPACEDEGEFYGIHDRASYLPASNVQTGETWHGDECEIWCSAQVRQTRVFGPNLLLTRRITTHLGSNKLSVHDRIENEGFEPAPMVVLYHCNFGFPVVSEYSQVRAPSAQCTPRDEAAQVGADKWMQLEPPQPGYAERVYFHDMTPDENGFVRAEIYNNQLNFGALCELLRRYAAALYAVENDGGRHLCLWSGAEQRAAGLARRVALSVASCRFCSRARRASSILNWECWSRTCNGV
jgi:hypothetical protein